MSMHLCRVRNPPQVQPIRVNLVIRNQDEALWKACFQPSILCEPQLSPNAFVSANTNWSRSIPLRHRGYRNTKRLLGLHHVGVEIVSVDEVERGTHKLRSKDANTTAVKPCEDEKTADDLHGGAMIPSWLLGLPYLLHFQHSIRLRCEFHAAWWVPLSWLGRWHGEYAML